MDADTRHQLKQNELAEALGKLRDLRDPRFLFTLIGVLAILVSALAWYGWRASQRHGQEVSSQRLNEIAVGLESGDGARLTGAQADLRAFIAENKDPEGTALARLLLARALFDQAVNDPARRPAGFEEAAVVLEQLRAADTSAMLAASASYLLGSTYESLREFDKARAVWESIANEPTYAGLPFRDMAAERLGDFDELVPRVAFEPGDPPAPAPPAPTMQVDPSSIQFLPAAPISEPGRPAGETPPAVDQPEPAEEERQAGTPQSAPSQSP